MAGKDTGRALRAGFIASHLQSGSREWKGLWDKLRNLKLVPNNPLPPGIIHFPRILQLSKTSTNSGPSAQTSTPMGEYCTFQPQKVCQGGGIVFDSYIKEKLNSLVITNCPPNVYILGEKTHQSTLMFPFIKAWSVIWVLNYSYSAINFPFCNTKLSCLSQEPLSLWLFWIILLFLCVIPA